ncbi:UDP-glycosyltransferase 708G1-like [Nymphaea colorata]|uniref:UDP-glycosyltransferase 708G1-like n=1 Tax=Nymphaea colorata TaxID=210225 RepID=UPI00129D5F1F|nr:UDP-glycosyltransferase 708G1-like [Nymphaea colorata]
MAGNGGAHVVILPSAGMGHLSPFIHLASVLSNHGICVTFITTLPTVTAAESDRLNSFLSSNPHIRPLPFHPTPVSTDKVSNPFTIQTESIRHSPALLRSLLADAGPFSAFISDIAVASCTTDIAASLSIPNYILFTSSATMLALVACFPATAEIATSSAAADFTITGVGPFPGYCLDPALRDPNNLFVTHFMDNGRALSKAAGILINTLYEMEDASIKALNDGAVVAGFPSVFSIGPLVFDGEAMPEEGGHDQVLEWLDQQQERSVAYVSFGSRNALSSNQILELAAGLERSGCRFLWVVKTKDVDIDEDGGAVLEELLPGGFLERVKGRGMVVNRWVRQEAVLAHPAVGGFVNHCGWNSVTEAVWHGVPIFAWPLTADQMMNATVVEKSGGGVWERSWRGGEGLVVKGEEIGKRLKEWMEDVRLRDKAGEIKQKARRAVGSGGSSEIALMEVMKRWT